MEISFSCSIRAIFIPQKIIYLFINFVRELFNRPSKNCQIVLFIYLFQKQSFQLERLHIFA